MIKACFKASVEITRMMTLSVPAYMQLQVHVLLLKQVSIYILCMYIMCIIEDIIYYIPIIYIYQ